MRLGLDLPITVFLPKNIFLLKVHWLTRDFFWRPKSAGRAPRVVYFTMITIA